MRLTLKMISLLLFSCYPALSFGGYNILESKPVRCGIEHDYQGVAGTLVEGPLPNNKNIAPWSTYKSSYYGSTSWYGTGIIVSSIEVDNTYVQPKLKYNSSHFPTGTGYGDVIVGFLQRWFPHVGDLGSSTVVFSERNAPTLGFFLPSGNYKPGVYRGTIVYKVFSGVVGSDDYSYDYQKAFRWAIQHRGYLCRDSLKITIINSCKLAASDINYNSVNAVEIEQGRAIKQSDMSLTCLLSDSVKLTFFSNNVSSDNVTVDVGNNVESLLSISKSEGDVVKSRDVIPVESSVNYSYKINSTLRKKNESIPLTGGSINGKAIIQVEFN